MSLWLRVRGELAGAWRSMRYDLRGRAAERPDGPDVTSTGLSTFPGSLMEWRTATPETNARPPRRFVAVTALCLLALIGAIGSYLLVTRGLAAAGDRPLAAPSQPVVPTPADTPGTGTARPDDAIGPPSHPKAARPVPATTNVARGAAPVATKAGIAQTRPRRPAAHHAPAATPECHCVTPPVPTPTAPSPSVGHSPDPGGSPTGSPSVPPSTSTGPSAEPSDQTTDGDHRRDRRHWPKNG
ncbi:hypothetical protein [Actinoplanes sp. NPDC020271]|uniref:hypothetical protein n=1 Tax=Actinoplanes sp. NPDC020271 TaxID=3363896 RepID=UPI0037B394DA